MSYEWNWAVLWGPVATGEQAMYLDWIASGVLTTVSVALLAGVIGFFAGNVVAVLRTVPSRVLNAIGTAYVETIRGVPLIVQLFFWYFTVPDILPNWAGDSFKQLEPTKQLFSAAVVCLGLYTSVRVAEQLRGALGALSPGQMHAAKALGMTTLLAYRLVLLPRVLRSLMPTLTSEAASLIKNTSVVSTIGLLDLTAQAKQLVEFTAHSYESFIVATVLYALLCASAILVMRFIEKKVRLKGNLDS